MNNNQNTKRDEERLEKIYSSFQLLNTNSSDQTSGLETILCERLGSLYEKVSFFKIVSEVPKKTSGNLESSELDDSDVVKIPVKYHKVTYRVLGVKSDTEISEKELSALENLMDGVGIAMRDHKLEDLIYSSKKLCLTLDLVNPRITLNSLGADFKGITVERITPLNKNSNAYEVSYEGSMNLENVLEDLEIVKRYEALDNGNLKIDTNEDSMRAILDAGALIESIEVMDEKLRMKVEIPANAEKNILFDAIETISEEWKVVSKEMRTNDSIVSKDKIDLNLTEKQLSALTSAYSRGYYDNPRKVNAKQLASEMGISDSTLFQHLQAAHKKVIKNHLGDEAETKKLSENNLTN